MIRELTLNQKNIQDNIAGLVTLLQTLASDNEKMRAEIQNLALIVEKQRTAIFSTTSSPMAQPTPVLNTVQKLSGSAASKHAPAATPVTATASTTSSSPPASEWTQVVRTPAPRRQKAPLSDRKRLATARAFFAPDSADTPSGYEYVYIHRKRAIDRKDIRHRFSLLGITTARVIDIIFPAHSVVGILIHKEFKAAFTAILDECKIATITDFDPRAAANIVDPKYDTMEPAQKTLFAAALHQDRCIRTLYFVREYLVPSVAKFFIEQNWIPMSLADSIIKERIPRPTKKRSTMSTAAAAEAFLASINVHGVPDTNMDNSPAITEEFHENAYGSDSDESIKDADPLSDTDEEKEVLSSDKPTTQ